MFKNICVAFFENKIINYNNWKLKWQVSKFFAGFCLACSILLIFD